MKGGPFIEFSSIPEAADGRPINQGESVRIPVGRRRITLGYVGLNLSVPERVQFRYLLEGFDRDWSEQAAARQAVYTNLSPGSYTFRVTASNSDSLWDGSEDKVRFEIEPVFWQTGWFRLSCGLACLFAGMVLYRFRLRQLARRLNVRFEERLAERTRIAQELHDTLLQGILSVSMQLQVAAAQVPADSPAKPLLNRVVHLMQDVIDEGRNVVRGLRTSSSIPQGLEQAFTRVPLELAIQDQTGFRVIAQGRARPLNPIIRDEVYRIGREAVANALRHSEAKCIEVELEHTARQLRVLVRDNGRGIESQVLQSGREGHWGLAGMRERAERIGARLKVWSRAAAGTEVELSVPASIAFQDQLVEGPLGWLSRWYLRIAGAGNTERSIPRP